jgi:hypothetical protein
MDAERPPHLEWNRYLPFLSHTHTVILASNTHRLTSRRLGSSSRHPQATPNPGFRHPHAAHDAAFRYAILGPEKTDWAQIAEQKAEFANIAQRILERAVEAGHVRSDLSFNDFVLITRGAMANMNPDDDDWQRHVALMLEGVRTPVA